MSVNSQPLARYVHQSEVEEGAPTGGTIGCCDFWRLKSTRLRFAAGVQFCYPVVLNKRSVGEMAHFQLRFYEPYGKNRNKRAMVSKLDIEARDGGDAIEQAQVAQIAHLNDGAHIILWSADGRDLKHWPSK